MSGNIDNELKYLKEEADRAHETVDDWMGALKALRDFQKKHGLLPTLVPMDNTRLADRSSILRRAKELGFSKK